MSKTIDEGNDSFQIQQKRQQRRIELRKDIILGSTLRSLHRKQGTESYLLQVIEPHLKKSDRKLFGLPF